MSVTDKFIHHRNLLVKGQSELSLIVNSVQQGLLVWLVLRDMFPPEIMRRSYIILVVFLCIVAISLLKWVWGWLFDKYKLVDQDMSWLMKRTPEIIELDNKLTEVLGELQKNHEANSS